MNLTREFESMNKLLLPAAALATTVLFAASAQAGEVFKLEYLKADKCVLKKVEVQDVDLCIKKLNQSIQDDCTGSGGTYKKGAMTCSIPSPQAAAGFKKLIDKNFGGTGPYNPIPDRQAMAIKEPIAGCVKGADQDPRKCGKR